jgi:hypothetical protein
MTLEQSRHSLVVVASEMGLPTASAWVGHSCEQGQPPLAIRHNVRGTDRPQAYIE